MTWCVDFVPSNVSINERLGHTSAGKIELGVQRPGHTSSASRVYAVQALVSHGPCGPLSRSLTARSYPYCRGWVRQQCDAESLCEG